MGANLRPHHWSGNLSEETAGLCDAHWEIDTGRQVLTSIGEVNTARPRQQLDKHMSNNTAAPSIELSDSAVKRLSEMLAAESDGNLKLRIAVQGTDLKVFKSRIRRAELAKIADEIGAEIIYLPRGEHAESEESGEQGRRRRRRRHDRD